MHVHKNRFLTLVLAGALSLGAAACGSDNSSDSSATSGGASSTEKVSGKIAIDGSSTVFPFAQAAAELFREQQPDVNVTVGESGTGGGFEKFCAGETDISNASRPIDEAEEVPICKKNKVAYEQVQVANDGIAIVTNPSLKIDCLTTDQLKQLWVDDKVSDYSDLGVDGASGKVSLYGPGTDSGTFDFFTEEINGEKGVTRKDYQPSEDDNVLVQGVAGDPTGLGYFGFSYYEQNQDKLNLVAVDGGGGCVAPSVETIQDGSYKPLARPIFMYPSDKALQRPEVKAFMEFIVDNYADIASAAQIVAMTDAQAATSKTAVDKLAGS
jgi:phosphate transport system substrate-binding protein